MHQLVLIKLIEYAKELKPIANQKTIKKFIRFLLQATAEYNT